MIDNMPTLIGGAMEDLLMLVCIILLDSRTGWTVTALAETFVEVDRSRLDANLLV